MDFDFSPRAAEVADRAETFFQREILPRHRDWHAADGAPDWLPSLRDKARAAGLWNMGLTRLPEGVPGTPLSNLDFAPVAEITGRLPWASYVFNCHAPDLPNMITLADTGTPEQQDRWLMPLLRGEMRSAFAMTEPAVGSSDARNIAMRAERTERGWALTGRKWWASGAAHPDCAFLIVMAATGEPGGRNSHSAFIVPTDAPGLEIVRRLRFLGWSETGGGGTELDFQGVEVSEDALLGREGGGFEVAQTRLGPARVHHAMRAMGLAEVLIGLMTARAAERRTFGRTLSEYDTVQGWIARSRVELEQARLLVLRAAWRLDRQGHAAAWGDVSAVKIAVPAMLQGIADRAVQVFGAMGGTDDTPIHAAFAQARAFRIFDGPDEVHLRQLFRQEAPPAGPLADSPYLTPGTPA
jgi:acyl-CoA dehydrogenase